MGLLHRMKTFHHKIKSISYGNLDYWAITFDLLYCKIRYRTSTHEYLTYKFYNYKHRYRKNFILTKHKKQYEKINFRGLTRSKYITYKYIPDLYQREIILAPQCGEDAFINFLKKHQRIVIKPDTGSLGKGVEIVEYCDDTVAKELFATFIKNKPKICEEFIIQHPLLKQLNPSSVNTIRITSLMQNGDVEIISATLKCGVGEDKVTDNLSLGGIGAQVDISSGIVSTYGQDFKNQKYIFHPTTGTQIIGMQLPNWDATIALVKAAHKRLPQCTVFGWDVAITETGADIVEANNRPGSRIMQRMDGIPKGQKIIPLLRHDTLKEKRSIYSSDIKRLYKKEFQIESTTN